MRKVLAVGAVLVASVLGSAVRAQPPASPPACPGDYEVIRTDTIKPGKLDVFLKATRDHQAWYTSHGLKDQILVGRILDPEAGSPGFSPTTAMTIHTHGGMGPPPHAADDAAWNAYVAEYNDSSDQAGLTLACVTPAGQ